MSSGSESDEEYVPGEPEKVSEEESADEETEKQYENEQEKKSSKRKIVQKSKGTKIRKTRNGTKTVAIESDEEIDDKPEEIANPEEDKKKEDDLWAKFLEGTDTKPKPSAKDNTASTVTVTKPTPTQSTDIKDTKKNDDVKDRDKRIFEFAGETIVVENNVIKERVKTAESTVKPNSPAARIPSATGSGLSGVLGQLNKKNKLSTLEKSKLDWSTYKQDEGIEDEIQSHNKGKKGFLDRKDFLERADMRQYEIERDLRLTRRSNR